METVYTIWKESTRLYELPREAVPKPCAFSAQSISFGTSSRYKEFNREGENGEEGKKKTKRPLITLIFTN
jgi:hypothetical protein